MIERVEEVSANLDVFRFSEPEVLEDRKIGIVDGRQQEGIPPNVGLSPVTSLNVTSIRIICEIGNNSSVSNCSTTASPTAERSHSTADAFGSAWIENGAVPGVVAI